MSVEIAWKQNILVTDSYLLELLLVVFGLGLQAFVCDFSRQKHLQCTINSNDAWLKNYFQKISNWNRIWMISNRYPLFSYVFSTCCNVVLYVSPIERVSNTLGKEWSGCIFWGQILYENSHFTLFCFPNEVTRFILRRGKYIF